MHPHDEGPTASNLRLKMRGLVQFVARLFFGYEGDGRGYEKMLWPIALGIVCVCFEMKDINCMDSMLSIILSYDYGFNAINHFVL